MWKACQQKNSLNEKFLKIYDAGEMAAVIPLENEPRDMAAGIIKKPPDLIRIKCIQDLS